MQFIALLRALAMVVDSHGVSHAELERMLCGRIAAGRSAEERLRGLPPGTGQDELHALVARKTAVEKSGLARTDGRRERAGGQRIGELLAGKFPKNAMPPRGRVEVCVDVLFEVLEEKDRPGCDDDRYGSRELWLDLWLEADQGKIPTLGDRAKTVTGYLDIALRQLTLPQPTPPPTDDAPDLPAIDNQPATAPTPAAAAGLSALAAALSASAVAAPPGRRAATTRLTTIAVTLIVVTTGLVITVAALLWPGRPGPSAGEVVLEVPAPYALAPGSPGITIPLDLAGVGRQTDWVLTLRLRLASAAPADACVHDSQLSYTLRNNGTVVGRGPLPAGRPQLVAGPLRLGEIGDGHRLQLTVAATVGAVDAGCQFTLDPSGTSAHAPGLTG